MAQTENTAVNRLVQLAQQKPLEVDVDLDDLFVDSTARAAREVARRASEAKAPLPPPFRAAGGTPAPEMIPTAPPAALARERAPSATGNLSIVPPPVPARPSQAMAAVPPPVPPRPSQAMAAVAPPVAAPPVDDVPTRPFDAIEEDEVTSLAPEPSTAPRLPPPPVSSAPAFHGFEDGWFDDSRAVSLQEPADEVFVQTHGVPLARRNLTLWYVAGAFALGLGIAALLFWPGDGAAPARQQPAQAAAPTPEAAAPAPSITPLPVVTPAPAVAAVEPADAVVPADEVLAAVEAAPVAAAGMVTLSFTSSPAGAAVLLVDGGTTLPIGTTPVELQVPAGKQYQAMFSLDGHASALLPVDPGVSQQVIATLAASGAAGPADETIVAAPAPAPAAQAQTQVAPPPAAQAAAAVAADRGAEQARAAAKRDRKRTARAEAPARADKPKAAAASAGKGTLKIGAKPPCDIFVDGKRTGLVTPQASISLPAGKHTITLVNKEHKIKEQIRVSIEAGETTKVIKDLTSRM